MLSNKASSDFLKSALNKSHSDWFCAYRTLSTTAFSQKHQGHKPLQSWSSSLNRQLFLNSFEKRNVKNLASSGTLETVGRRAPISFKDMIVFCMFSMSGGSIASARISFGAPISRSLVSSTTWTSKNRWYRQRGWTGRQGKSPDNKVLNKKGWTIKFLIFKASK